MVRRQGARAEEDTGRPGKDPKGEGQAGGGIEEGPTCGLLCGMGPPKVRSEAQGQGFLFSFFSPFFRSPLSFIFVLNVLSLPS